MKEEARDKINKYLTEKFICSVDEAPNDECFLEADAILSLEGENWRIAVVEKESEPPGAVVRDFPSANIVEIRETYQAEGWVKEVK